MKEPKITILRTAVGSPPSAGMIKELRKKGIRVVGLDSNPLSAGFYLCDKSYVVPKGNSPEFLKEILKICDIEKPKAIISGPEEEILTLAKHRKIFYEKNILILVPDFKAAKTCADKKLTYEFFEKEKVPFPKTYTIKNIKFPIIIKPRFGRGSADVFKATNKKELRFYIKKVKQPILQEFIEGTEYTIDVFSGSDGKSISVVPRTRIQTESGVSMKGKTVYDKEIIDWCKKIAETLKLTGPSCIQCIKGKNGIKFIEINTRFGGGSILSIKADPSIISNLIRMIQGKRPSPSKRFKKGLTMLRYYSEVFI